MLDTHNTTQEIVATPSNNPVPLPRNKAKKAPPKPRPRSEIVSSNKSLGSPFKTQTKTKDDSIVKKEKTIDSIPQFTPQNEINRKSIIEEEKHSRPNKIMEETKVNNECVVNEILKEELGEINKSGSKTNENEKIKNAGTPEENKKENQETPKGPKDSLNMDSNLKIFDKPEQNTSHVIKVEKSLEKLNELKKQQPDAPRLSKNLTKSMPDISQLQKMAHTEIFSSQKFLGERKPPEVIAMIPKERKRSPKKFDTFGKRRFQIGTSLLENFDDTASIHSRQSNDSKTGNFTRNNSVNSALEAFNFMDEFSDLDESTFSGSLSKNSKVTNEIFNQLFGIHNLEDIEIHKNQSISSLRSLRSLPGFLSDSSGMRKWNNVEDLDYISLTSTETKNKWVFGEASDTGMFFFIVIAFFKLFLFNVK